MNRDKEDLGETRIIEHLTDETTNIYVDDALRQKTVQNDNPTAHQETEKKGMRIKSEIFSFLKDIVISLVVVLVIVNYIVRPIQVKGSSMYSTLEEGYFGFSNLIGYRFSGVQRFDIVIVYVAEKKEYLIKRVIGLPGERVAYRNDQLYINDEAIDEPFLDKSYMSTYPGIFTTDFTTEVLGEDEYFCMGDNRPHSSDSRYYGAFRRSDIVSKGVFIVFPFKGFGVYTW